MLFWIRKPHPSVLDAQQLLVSKYAGRHICVYQKIVSVLDWPAALEASRLEDEIWAGCRLQYASRCGLFATGSGRLWRRHGHKDHTTIQTMHSAVSLDDLQVVLLRAERLLSIGDQA